MHLFFQQAVNGKPAANGSCAVYGQQKNRDGPLIFHKRDGPLCETGPPGGTGPPKGTGPPVQGKFKGTGPPESGFL